MTDSSEIQWWSPGPQPGELAPEVAKATKDLRMLVYRRSVALAHWRAHRADCARCAGVIPPAGPAQCCRAGRRRLERYLKVAADGRAAERLLASYAAGRQGRLV